MNATPPAPLLSFPDLQSGMSHLARLPLANPAVAEQQLMQFLDSLLAAPPDPSDLFALLEQARVPMCFVEEEMARRYHNKPLILGDVEEAAFLQVVTAWRKMGKAYALCAQLERSDHADPQHRTRIATILHRCVYYTGMIILEHYRARRELPAGIWLDLHGFYETAEEWGVGTGPVDDVLENGSQTTHCTAAYVTILLIEMASPYSLSVRDLNLIRRWAGMWAPLVAVQRLPGGSPTPPYVVELMKEGALRPTRPSEEFGPDARRLEVSRLGLQINQMLNQLRQRVAPSQLGLGEETTGHVLNLLDQLSRPWTLSAAARKFRRFPSTGRARVCVGFEAMHFAVAGKEFVQPDSAQTYSRDQFDTLFTFRQMANPAQQLTIRPQPDFPTDEWDVLNHSANGFRLARSAAGQKLAHGQLLALCPHDGDRFLLAQASWLMQEQEGGLLAGVSVLPGLPEGVAVRVAGVPHGNSEQFVRAFLLPAIPAIDEHGSLVLPTGMYQASRVLEVRAEKDNWQVRMKNVLQRGIDFERVSYEVV